ncbi:MAG: PadR family transcriptional regulator [Frankiaceae bacterium]
MSRRSGVLELAVLGLLHESPLHGYELRKRLNTVLGSFRALSYGSLYPALRDLRAAGWICEDTSANEPATLSARRGKVIYKLTAEGKERFQELLAEAGPSAWEDENFGVHFAFFAQTDAQTRMRILEGRRSRLEERAHSFRTALTRTRAKLDGYTAELQRHGLESAEREVRWLDELIETERASSTRATRADPTGTPVPSPSTSTDHARSAVRTSTEN